MLFVEKDITKIEVSQWADFVKNHPKGSVFQTPDMYNCYKNTPNHTPIILVAKSDGNIVGVLLAVIISEGGNLKKYFTSRSIIIGGPIVKNDNNEIISFLLKEYNLYIKGKAIYTQIRNYYEQLLNNDAFQENNYRFKSHLNFRIKLDTPDNIWNRIGKGRTKQIKKAIKNQLLVEVYENDICEDLIIQGYDIIKSVYKRAGLPLVGIDLIKEVCNKKLLVLFVVKDSTDKIIGCRFGIKYKDEIYGWYAGSYSEYYKLFPNDILIWETLKWSCEHSYKVFDYGGAGEPNKPYGVRTFKSQMGGELVNYGRYELVHKKILYKIGQLGMAILKSRKKSGGVEVLDYQSVSKVEWEAFIFNNAKGNIFQTSAMYELYANTSHNKPNVLALRRNGKIKAILLSVIITNGNSILKYLTARSIIIGGPLVVGNSNYYTELLLKEYKKRLPWYVIYSEIRPIYDLEFLKESFIKSRFKREGHYNIYLNLNQRGSVMWNQLHKERKRNIQQAEKKGLVFKEICDKTEINNIVDLIVRTYKRKGVPLSYNDIFVKAIELMPQEVKFFGAYKDDKIVAGQVRLCYKDLVYAWFAGSDENYFKMRPNDFLLWNVIKWSRRNKYKVFDFGGGGKPGVSYGVRDYKLKYGGQMEDFGRYVYIKRPLLYWFASNAYKLFHKIKGK